MSERTLSVAGVAPGDQGYIFALLPSYPAGFYRVQTRVVPNLTWTVGPVTVNGQMSTVPNVPGFGTFQAAYARAADCDAAGNLLTSFGYSTLYQASDGQ